MGSREYRGSLRSGGAWRRSVEIRRSDGKANSSPRSRFESFEAESFDFSEMPSVPSHERELEMNRAGGDPQVVLSDLPLPRFALDRGAELRVCRHDRGGITDGDADGKEFSDLIGWMARPNASVLELAENDPRDAQRFAGIRRRKRSCPRLSSSQANEEARVRDQVHGSCLAEERSSTLFSISSLLGRRSVPFAFTNRRKAPSVPGSGRTRLTTEEKDSRPSRFQAFSRV